MKIELYGLGASHLACRRWIGHRPCGLLVSAPGLAQIAGSAQGDQGAPAHTAVAERQAAPRADSLADRVELQEVVVTATRRAEAALQVPASLTVLGGAMLDQLGAKMHSGLCAARAGSAGC